MKNQNNPLNDITHTERRLRAVLNRLVKKAHRVNCCLSPNIVDPIIDLDWGNVGSMSNFLDMLEEVDQRGEFPDRGAAETFKGPLKVSPLPVFHGALGGETMRQESLLGNDEKDHGWIRIWRKLLDNPIFKDSEAVHLFIYLLLKANHKQNKFLFNQREVAIDRGQMVTGIERMSKDTGLTHRQIRTRLTLLENIGILTRKTTNRFSIITICNYDHYQSRDNEERQAERQTNDKQTTTNKNVKNVKNKNNGSSVNKTTDPRVKEFFDYWGETFLKETGQPYTFSFGKEGRLVKDLLKVHSLETLHEVTRAFFKDEQCRRRGLTIGIFFQEINRLVGLNKDIIRLEEYPDLAGGKA